MSNFYSTFADLIAYAPKHCLEITYRPRQQHSLSIDASFYRLGELLLRLVEMKVKLC